MVILLLYNHGKAYIDDLQVLFHASGTHWSEYQVHGSEIAELEVIPTKSTPQELLEPQTVKVLEKPPPVRIVVQPSSAEQGSFTDPAIMSYARTFFHQTICLSVSVPSGTYR